MRDDRVAIFDTLKIHNDDQSLIDRYALYLHILSRYDTIRYYSCQVCFAYFVLNFNSLKNKQIK